MTKPSLRSLAIRGSAWTLGAYGLSQVIRFAGNVVMARLLFPEAFGLMALINVFMIGLEMFSDVGLGPSIIQNKRGDDPDFLNTAWTIQVVRGLILWVCLCLIAYPGAVFYEEPELATLIPVAGVSAMIAGFNSTSMFTCNRHLDIGRLMLVELASAALAIVFMLAWAWVSPSVWALVFGGIVGKVATTILSHTVLPGTRNRFLWERPASRELFRFGKWIFVSSLLTFWAAQADRLIFGKMVSIAELGVYSVGLVLATTPIEAILRIGARVVFPVYSKLKDNPLGLRDSFQSVRLPLVAGGGVCIAGVIAIGPGTVDLLYDDRYAAAGWILQLLAIGAWFRILQAPAGAALLAVGKPVWVAAGNGAKVVGLAALIPLGFYLRGFEGAIAGIVVADVLNYAATMLGVKLHKLPGLLADTVLTALVGALGVLALITTEHLMPIAPRIVATILAPGFAVVVTSLVLGFIWLKLTHQGVRDLFKMG